MNITSVLERMDNALRQRTQEISAEKIRVKHGSEAAMSNAEITEQVNRLNGESQNFGERVMFAFNEKTNSIIVKFIDKESNEVVREYPSKDIMKLAEHMHDYLGMLVDESR